MGKRKIGALVAACAVLVGVWGCDSVRVVGDAGRDAGRLSDAGPGADAGRDAAADAGTDAGRDAGPTDGGPACDPVRQIGCPARMTCRHTDDGPLPWSGPVECQDNGPLMEGPVSESCIENMDGMRRDLCGLGLVCGASACTRYCDPDGAPCPDLDGAPRYCWPADIWGVAICHTAPPP